RGPPKGCQFQKLADLPLGFLDTRERFPTDRRVRDRNWRAMGGRALSKRLTSARASDLRVKAPTMTEANITLPAEVVVERLVCLQAGRRRLSIRS
ncbi:MAG: hypothetical protein J2P48_23585, partial [Alphaproteobacteria bacterium]|nr:hypothetical protein [Alphaproteobacteria bacterium]